MATSSISITLNFVPGMRGMAKPIKLFREQLAYQRHVRWSRKEPEARRIALAARDPDQDRIDWDAYIEKLEK